MTDINERIARVQGWKFDGRKVNGEWLSVTTPGGQVVGPGLFPDYEHDLNEAMKLLEELRVEGVYLLILAQGTSAAMPDAYRVVGAGPAPRADTLDDLPRAICECYLSVREG